MYFKDAMAAQDVKTDVVPTPEWGADETVMIGSLNAHDMLEWLQNENDDRGGLNLAVKCWMNPDGTRIPILERADAVNALTQKDADVVGRIVNRCMVLNGLRKKKDDAKNGSGGTEPVASPSA